VTKRAGEPATERERWAVLLRVDPRTLRAIGNELGEATVVAGEVAESGARLLCDVVDCGHSGMRSAAARFVDRWAYGARCMADDAGTLASLLLDAEEAYIEIDEAVLEEWLR
jgi:hypothetical protein